MTAENTEMWSGRLPDTPDRQLYNDLTRLLITLERTRSVLGAQSTSLEEITLPEGLPEGYRQPIKESQKTVLNGIHTSFFAIGETMAQTSLEIDKLRPLVVQQISLKSVEEAALTEIISESPHVKEYFSKSTPEQVGKALEQYLKRILQLTIHNDDLLDKLDQNRITALEYSELLIQILAENRIEVKQDSLDELGQKLSCPEAGRALDELVISFKEKLRVVELEKFEDELSSEKIMEIEMGQLDKDLCRVGVGVEDRNFILALWSKLLPEDRILIVKDDTTASDTTLVLARMLGITNLQEVEPLARKVREAARDIKI